MSDSVSYVRVSQGDTLYGLFAEWYGTILGAGDRDSLVKEVQSLNPGLANIDLIHPGQVIAIPTVWPPVARTTQAPPEPPKSVVRVDPVAVALNKADPASLALMQMFDPEKLASGSMKGFGGQFTDWVYKASDAAVHDVRRVGLNYYRMQSGTLTRNQYDYQRRLSIGRADSKLNGLRSLITPGKTTKEVLRVDRTAKIRIHQHIDEIDRLSRIAKVAKGGIVVLKVIDVAETGVKIATADTDEERTVILLDQVTSTAGAAGAVALTVFLVGTPTGWLAMAGVAVVGIAGSLSAEYVGKKVQAEMLYDENGQRETTLIDKLWKGW